MQNVITSTTGAVVACMNTVANTADAFNGISEAARIRSESFARTTALKTEIQERRVEFELDLETQALDMIMDDDELRAAALNKHLNRGKPAQATQRPQVVKRTKIERPERKATKKTA